jgi:hypothetical protein
MTIHHHLGETIAVHREGDHYKASSTSGHVVLADTEQEAVEAIKQAIEEKKS